MQPCEKQSKPYFSYNVLLSKHEKKKMWSLPSKMIRKIYPEVNNNT